MGVSNLKFEGRSIRMYGPVSEEEMQLLRAEVREGFSRVTEIDVEFLSAKMDLDLDKVLGRPVTIEIQTEGQNKRYFSGHCVQVIYEGTLQGQAHFVASLRSWNWFLDQTKDCRIFQDKSALEIIKQIFSDAGFSDFKDNTTQTFPKRVYCTQYRETDHDFVHRLMVEEGIYYYFDYERDKDTMVMVDDTTKHENIKERSDISFYFKKDNYRRREDHIFDFRERMDLRTATVTLNDYNFKTPNSEMISAKTLKKGTHKHNKYEEYDYPGRYLETGRGDVLARTRAEAFAAEYDRVRGVGNVRTLSCGGRFTLTNHPRKSANREYLVIEAIHQLQIETDYDYGELEESALGERVTLDPEKNPDPYRVTFRAQPSSAPYRAPYPCPRPCIPGLQTAKVVGKGKDEIYTDPDGYGMVKVQFHWDREGKEDENSSCWIRKAEPWSGKNWGMVWIPRVGQEVVVQFEEGDPDRPMIVGMLFNDATKHPYTLPANKTMMGWTTRSSEKGKSDTFHELVFEDKIEKEFIRIQSERDWKQIVKNNAEITVGLEHKDKGDYSLTIQNDMTETVKKGNHTFTVETGKEDYSVKKDRNMTVDGNHNETVKKNQKLDIKGNQNIKVMKSITVQAMQKITLKANTKITLQVGGSKIDISTASIKIKAPMVDLNAQGMGKVKAGGMLQLNASGIAMLKGSATKIN